MHLVHFLMCLTKKIILMGNKHKTPWLNVYCGLRISNSFQQVADNFKQSTESLNYSLEPDAKKGNDGDDGRQKQAHHHKVDHSPEFSFLSIT